MFMLLCLTFQLFYLRESGHYGSVRQQLREICISAAVDGKPTVLVITNSIDIRSQDWEDIYKLMNEGRNNKQVKFQIWQCMSNFSSILGPQLLYNHAYMYM